MDDPYEKLRSPEPTPDDELCRCTGGRSIKLMQALSSNPVNCLDCNGEVPPERLRPTWALVDDIAHWCTLFGAIDQLWLDSGAYETWAFSQLSDIHSPINQMGIEVVAQLNLLRPCYYWYFQDESGNDDSPISICPLCGKDFSVYPHGLYRQLICEGCHIVTSGDRGGSV